MAKKKNINADVVVGETNIKVEKNEKSTKVKVKTPKVDIELTKEDNTKEFKLDSEKLDVIVTKEGKVSVVAETGFLKRVGNLIAKIFKK
jgi:cytochrome c biogenesis protein ResB